MVSRVSFPKTHKLVQALFAGSKANRAMNREFSEGPIDVFPACAGLDVIWSDDTDYLRFKKLLVEKLMADPTLQASVDDAGRVTGNGIRSDWRGLLYVGGFGQLNATWPMLDNEQLRSDKKLINTLQGYDFYKRVYQAIVRLFFSDLEQQPMKLRKYSSSTIPWFETDMTQKVRICGYALQNAQKAGELIKKGNYVQAFVQYQVGGAYYVVYRHQASDAWIQDADGVYHPKPRFIADREYALSGGTSGSWKEADRSFNQDFAPKHLIGRSDFARERKRTAMGGPLVTNAIMMPIAQAVRARIYEKYAFSFHHTTRQSIETDLVKWEGIIPVDVSQHDQLWPSSWLLDLIADELLLMGYPDWWVEIYRMKGRLPVYVSSVGPDEGQTLLGDWRNPDVNMGLHSGNAFTDLEGTILMCGAYLITQLEHITPEVIDSLDTVSKTMDYIDGYLRGEKGICQKSKSDDALLGILDKSLLRRHNSLLEKLQAEEQVSKIMEIGYEHGGAFLGSILLFGPDKHPSSLRLIGNVVSMVVNMFSPEYGVNSAVRSKRRQGLKRPYPGIAWGSTREVFGDAPAFPAVMKHIEDAWFEVYGISYSYYRDTMYKEDMRQLTKDLDSKDEWSNLSLIEKEVISAPEKLQYRYTELDVREEIVELAFSGVPEELVTPFFEAVTQNINMYGGLHG